MLKRFSIFNKPTSLSFDYKTILDIETPELAEEKAYELISTNLIQVHSILKPAIEKMLLNFEFLFYLINNNLNESATKIFGEYMLTFISKGNISPYVEKLKKLANDLVIAQAFIDYGFRDKQVNSEFINPYIMQAVIHLKLTVLKDFSQAGERRKILINNSL